MPERQEIESFIRETAARYGVDPELIIRQCETESGFRQEAVSKCGAIGLMQLMPATAEALDVDPHDWKQNIEGGVRLMAQLLKRYHGDTQKSLAAYNCGPGRLAGILEVHGSEWREHLPDETRRYLDKILGTINA